MKRLRRILHPTDFSRASAPAFEKALALARDDGAELLVLHVLLPPTPFVADGYVPPATYQDLEAAAWRGAERGLAKLSAKARKARVRVKGLMLEGAPWERIARVARTKRADMIVMGTHGRTGLSKFFMGSVAERVIPRAPCPVMTVRGKSRAPSGRKGR